MADFTTNYGWAIEIEYNENYYAQAVALREAIDTTVKSVEDKADANTAALATHKANGDTDILHVTADEKASITHAEYIWQTAIQELTATEDDVLGANLTTNGTFDTDTDWTKGSGWTVADGKATKAAGTAATISQTISSLTAGETFRISFLLSDVTAGTIAPWAGMTAGTSVSVDGWHTQDVVATTNTTFSFLADSSFVGSVETVTVRPLEEVANTDKKLAVIVRENQIVYGNDLSQSAWTKTRSSIVSTGIIAPRNQTYQGLVADTTPTSTHHTSQLFTPTSGAGRAVFEGDSLPGEQPWIRVNNLTSSEYANINLSTGEIGLTAGDPVADIQCTNLGCRWRVEMDVVAGSNQFLIHSAPADTSAAPSYTGDGSTIDTYHANLNVREGTLANPISPIDNGSSTYPRTQLVEIQTDPALKHAAGFVLTADGAWVPTSTVNGLLMDESPANVNAMRQAGLYKGVESGAWGPLVAGITFWANDDSGDYCELFAETGITGTNDELVVSLAAPDTGDESTKFLPSSVRSVGDVYNDIYTVMIPSYKDAAQNASIDTDSVSDGMFLNWGTNYSSDCSYSVVAIWKWREITIPG